MTLLELAERCEKAAGPDRDLDAAIYDLTPHALDYQRIGIRLKDTSRLDRYHDGWVTVYGAKGEADPYPEDLPRYTASLDAAQKLVPARCWVRMDDWPRDISGIVAFVQPIREPDVEGGNGSAKTLPLALVAAALRASHGAN